MQNQGFVREAEKLLDEVTRTDPGHTDAWLRLSQLHVAQGHIARAEACCRKAIELLPDSTELLDQLARILLQSGKFSDAAGVCQQLLQRQPDSALYHFLLGSARQSLQQYDEACDSFRRAIALNPDYADAYHALGYIAYTRHRYQEAAEYYRQVLRLNPANAQVHNSLGTILQALGRYNEALTHYDRAIGAVPVFADAHFGRGNTLIVQGRTEEAVHSLNEAIRLQPDHANARISLASALMSQGRHDEALASCEQALQLSPQNADAIALAATIEQHTGKAGQALARLQPWIEQDNLNVNQAIAFAEVSKTLDRPQPAIELLERILTQGEALPATSRRNLHFNLGRLYDKTARYDQAFEHYREGNRLRPREYDPAANQREFDAIIRVHNTAFMASAPRAREQTDRPVFVVGMPRTGTTLVEQILASHPRVYGAGELPWMWQMVARLPAMPGITLAWPDSMTQLDTDGIERLARQYLEQLDKTAPGTDRVVDKMPGNFRFLGLIALLFPRARVIHCLRDPLDTCLSCYFQDFSRTHAYSYDLADLGSYYRDYQRLMAHWREVVDIPILDIRYEELVDSQEAVSRAMIDFIGLEWDPACLDFHGSGRFVATASYDQVRRPLYRKSVARWKHYAAHLGALIEALQPDGR